jgi:hypothetical protein
MKKIHTRKENQHLRHEYEDNRVSHLRLPSSTRKNIPIIYNTDIMEGLTAATGVSDTILIRQILRGERLRGRYKVFRKLFPSRG